MTKRGEKVRKVKAWAVVSRHNDDVRVFPGGTLSIFIFKTDAIAYRNYILNKYHDEKSAVIKLAIISWEDD